MKVVKSRTREPVCFKIRRTEKFGYTCEYARRPEDAASDGALAIAPRTLHLVLALAGGDLKAQE
jgi:hypothetical protein